MSATDHAGCAAAALDIATRHGDLGYAVDVLTETPTDRAEYPPFLVHCPHGATFWIVPTRQTIAYWILEQIA